jgi:hypothetical protein
MTLYKELRNPKHWSGGRTPFTYMGMPAVLDYAENPKTGLPSGKSRMSRGMGTMTLLRKRLLP